MATPFLLGWINTRRERYIYLLPRVDKNRGTQRAFPSFLPSFYYPWRRHIQSWQAFVILHTGASERIFPQREVKKGWISQKSVGWLSSVEDRFPSPVETLPFPLFSRGYTRYARISRSPGEEGMFIAMRTRIPSCIAKGFVIISFLP